MKHLKMLGLAAMAIAAVFAFTAASASATELYSPKCTGVNGTCPAGTTINATLTGTASLTTTSGTLLDTCTGGGVHGTTANAGSATETVRGNVATAGLTWTGCTKTTDTLEGGELEIHWIPGTINGTVTGKNFKVTVEMVAEFGGTCSYTLGTGKDLGELVGSTSTTKDAKLSINAVVNGASGNSILCPSDTKWVAEYLVTTPTPLHVTEK